MTYIKLYYICFILPMIFLNVKSEKAPEIHFIVSGALNGTATFASLEFLEKNEKYLYFSFDFDFHSNNVKNSPNEAYFLISSDFNLLDSKSGKEKITYGFLEKEWTQINNGDDIKNIKWKNIKLLYKEKPYSDINYYYKIRRKDSNLKTMVLRIPTNGHAEGSITVENILNLPDFKENDRSTDI